MIFFNITLADFRLMSADVTLKRTIKLSQLEITQHFFLKQMDFTINVEGNVNAAKQFSIREKV